MNNKIVFAMWALLAMVNCYAAYSLHEFMYVAIAAWNIIITIVYGVTEGIKMKKQECNKIGEIRTESFNSRRSMGTHSYD